MSALDPTREEMKALIEAASNFAIDFIHDLDSAPASDLDGAMELAQKISGDIAEQGAPFDELLGVVGDAAGAR